MSAPVELILYWLARVLIGLLQSLPLKCVARLGRFCGGIAYWLDARHRNVALENLRRCFESDRSPRELRELARENFRRIGENYTCAVRTSAMTSDEIEEVLTVHGIERVLGADGKVSGNRIFAIGHFGNFELYARAGSHLPSHQFATTYKALRQPSLNRLLRSLRARSGCLYFERGNDLVALRQALRTQKLMLGLSADQHAGYRALRVPFLGEVCSTTKAPALYSLRYHCPLLVAVCYRTGLARWRIEVGPEIPTRENGRPRSIESITRDMNLVFEEAVRRDPANWFWVHRRWKPEKSRPNPN